MLFEYYIIRFEYSTLVYDARDRIMNMLIEEQYRCNFLMFPTPLDDHVNFGLYFFSFIYFFYRSYLLVVKRAIYRIAGRVNSENGIFIGPFQSGTTTGYRCVFLYAWIKTYSYFIFSLFLGPIYSEFKIEWAVCCHSFFMDRQVCRRRVDAKLKNLSRVAWEYKIKFLYKFKRVEH